MDERIYQIAGQIVEIHQKAYEFYLPLVLFQKQDAMAEHMLIVILLCILQLGRR